MGADLITLDEYKLIEGLTSSKDDDKLDALITSVSALVKAYCNNDLVDSAGSPGNIEYHDIMWDTYVVQLRKSPIINISGVYERSGQDSDYTQLINDGTDDKYEWHFDGITDAIFRTRTDGTYCNWPKGVDAVKVEYTSGYSTIPEDLKLAVVDLVTYYQKDEHYRRLSIGSSVRESNFTSSVRNDMGFPDHIQRILSLYRLK